MGFLYGNNANMIINAMTKLEDQICCLREEIANGSSGNLYTIDGTITDALRTVTLPEDGQLTFEGTNGTITFNTKAKGQPATEPDDLVILSQLSGGAEEGTFTLAVLNVGEWTVSDPDTICKYIKMGNIITIACTINLVRGSGAPGPNTLELGYVYMPTGYKITARSFGRWDVTDGAFTIADFEILDSVTVGETRLLLHSEDGCWAFGNASDTRIVNITATYMIEPTA